MSSKGSTQPVVPQKEVLEQRLKVAPPAANYNFAKAVKNFRVVEDDRGNVLIQGVWILDPVTGNPIQIASIGSGVNQILALEISPIELDETFQLSTSTLQFNPLQTARLAHVAHAVTVNASVIFLIDTRNLASVISIVSIGSGGTHTLTVEVSNDNTNFITIDSIAAALSQIKFYVVGTAGATTAVPPSAFRWLRITLGAAGVGNSTTVDIAVK